MKRVVTVLAVVMAAMFLGLGYRTEASAGTLGTKGVWFSFFEYADAGLGPDVPESEFRTNANLLFARIKSNGCNTVYFHVRSFDDAIYPSKVVKWSKRITKNKEDGLDYDPLKIVISYAHKYGLKFHAWMNPYRVTMKKVLDPGKESTTERIVAQVKEIVKNYDVDGIHFDDYFYPTNEKKYNKVSKAKRKQNVNKMIRAVYKTVKAGKKSLKFGISPAGNIEYCEKIGADVKTWMSEKGYVDYIIPQIYWSDRYILNGKKTKLFTDRLKEWQEINTNDVPMYIGLALYRAGCKLSDDTGWGKSSSNLVKQLAKIRAANTEGYVLFSYVDMYRETAYPEYKKFLSQVSTMRISCKKKTLRVGKKFRLRMSASISRVQNHIKWRSSNNRIAKVTKYGTVKAKSAGKVRIYGYYGSKKRSCVIRVKGKKKT